MRRRWDSFAMGFAGVMVGLLVAGVLPAGAAAGDPLILGEQNGSIKGTVMRTGGVRSLKIVNNRSTGVPLELVAEPGQPPMRVNSSHRVQGFNADLLDGRSAAEFLAIDRILYASVAQAGHLYGPGNAVSASRSSTGHYEIVFDRSTAGCVGMVNTGWANNDPSKGTAVLLTASIHMGTSASSDPKIADVRLWDQHDEVSRNSAFQVLLLCPAQRL